jgi:hypothetical protein
VTYALLSESFPVARKQHRCIWCGEAIPVGEKYRRERSVYDGNLQNFAWHPECAQDQQDELAAGGDAEFMQYSAERATRSMKENKHG